MTENERLKSERKEYFKTAPFSKKIGFIWDYYKLPIIAFLFIGTLVGCFINELLSKKETVLSGLLLNTSNTDNKIDDLEQDFLKTLKLDSDDYEVSFIDNYTLTGDAGVDYEVSQAVFVQMSAGFNDFTISPLKYMQNYAYQDCYRDLRTVLSKEQIEKYEPYFLYIDADYMEKLNKQIKEDESTETTELPDFKKPEDMKDPVPVLIDLSSFDTITKYYVTEKDSLVFGIIASTKKLDNTLSFLDCIAK